jgi:hypothetical protein
MNLKSPIPDFFVRPRNTVIQIIFTSIFAYAFILLYHPFGSQSWFDINTGQFAFYSGFVVVVGMMVVIISRVIMTQYRKWWTMTILGYALMVAAEVLAMTGFYMMIQKVFLHDRRFWFEVYYTAILNTTLILLIPYLISLLYFAWYDKKIHFDRLLREKESGREPRFVNITDENGESRLAIQLDELLYIEASENYVTIHYEDQTRTGRQMIRCSMKRMEEQMAGLPVVRCHRSYMVNLNRVRLARKTRSGLVVELNTAQPVQLPVSETYKEVVRGKMTG